MSGFATDCESLKLVLRRLTFLNAYFLGVGLRFSTGLLFTTSPEHSRASLFSASPLSDACIGVDVRTGDDVSSTVSAFWADELLPLSSASRRSCVDFGFGVGVLSDCIVSSTGLSGGSDAWKGKIIYIFVCAIEAVSDNRKTFGFS